MNTEQTHYNSEALQNTGRHLFSNKCRSFFATGYTFFHLPLPYPVCSMVLLAYCSGISGVPPETTLWMGTFSAPNFNIEPIFSGDDMNLLKGNFTHITSSFFDAISLIAYRNGRDKSICVIDYNPQLQLAKSPSVEVDLPQKYRDLNVEALLMCADKKAAYLGVAFAETGNDDYKSLLIFRRLQGTKDWVKLTQFSLPNDSSSPTMCIQDSTLFYAYLQPTTIETPPQLVEKFGETIPDKKVVVRKFALTSPAAK